MKKLIMMILNLVKKFTPNDYKRQMTSCNVNCEPSKELQEEAKKTLAKLSEKNIPLISTYGDSFTFCRQVNDNETWQHYLSELLRKRVEK